jgi:hypothetical protein
MSQMAHSRRSRAIHRTKLWLHWRSASRGHGRQQWPQGEARLALRVRPLVALAQDDQSGCASIAAARARGLARISPRWVDRLGTTALSYVCSGWLSSLLSCSVAPQRYLSPGTEASLPACCAAHQKRVANQAFAYLAGLQGSIWQDVRLIYLTHSPLKLRTHTKTV